MEIKELKKMCNGIKAEFAIGKSGITETFIESVHDYIDVHKIVKVKVNNAIDKNDVKRFAAEVAEKTDSEVLETKGFTFCLGVE